MEKIIVDFKDVRGRGNIISPSKSLEDYTPVFATLVEDEDLVAGSMSSVYQLSMGERFLLSVSKSKVPNRGSVTVTVVLTDENGDPVSGASVELFKEVIS